MSIQAAHQVRTNLNALTYAQKVWEGIDTPTSLSCYLLSKYGEMEQLVRMSVNPSNYVDPQDFFLDYQSVKLLSKYPYLKTGIDTKAVAYEKFLESEAQCRRTNVRLRMRESGQLFSPDAEHVISLMQRKISHILGDVPSFDAMAFDFGPGAAYGVRGETSVFNKVTASLECTYALAGILPDFLAEFPAWVSPDIPATVSLIRGNQLSFVPKDAKTDRPICIEPLLNGLYQKGVGSWIRDRLRSHGINLNDQGTNQKLASQAVELGLATVDFSSASDTISYRTVLDLLPIDWFEFLDVARSPSYEYEGKWTSFQKFSSMGNAYTFELETLIFYALAYACAEVLGIPVRTGSNLSVYGDDVIIPQSTFHLFSEVGSLLGFTINKEKSFNEGLFFESCGSDYFDSVLVRPFLVKKRLDRLLPTFYAINTLHRMASRIPKGNPKGQSVGRRLMAFRQELIALVPMRNRRYGPEGYGDGHIVAELDFCMSNSKTISRHPSWDGWWFRTYGEVSTLVSRPDWPSSYALYFTRDQRFGENRIPSLFVQYENFGRDLNLSLLGAPSAPSKSGDGYAVRGRTRIRDLRVFCSSEWRGCLT